jgi:hypothetical protein
MTYTTCRKCAHFHQTDAPCPIVSVPDDRLDLLVEQSSVPSLTALITRGKEQGLIKAQQGYRSTA